MTSEADLIFARANIALAKSQRLIASWLPPRTEEELRNAKSPEEIEREEEEIFKPMPELLGLGATPKEDKDSVPKEPSRDDVLRKRLFGKEFEKMFRVDGGRKGLGQGVSQRASKPMPVEMKRRAEDRDEEDEEEGRSGLGRSKRRVKAGAEKQVREDGTDPDDGEDVAVQETITRQKRTSNNYLDEILTAKQRKKRKKAGRCKVEPDDTTVRTDTLRTGRS